MVHKIIQQPLLLATLCLVSTSGMATSFGLSTSSALVSKETATNRDDYSRTVVSQTNKESKSTWEKIVSIFRGERVRTNGMGEEKFCSIA